MATLTKVGPNSRAKAIEKAQKEGASTLAGGLALAIGNHKLVVAGEKEAFALLNVESKTSGKWALPIVAGTVTSEGGKKSTFVLSEKPGAATLVIPDNFYLEMQPNASYTITVESRKGRKVITNVVPADGDVSEADNDDDLES